MRDWLNTQRRWLVVERLPFYAPELNPVELGMERARRTPQPAYSFLRRTGLSVS
jgi:transposase